LDEIYLFILMYILVCFLFAGIIVYVTLKYSNKNDNDKEDK